MPPLSQSLVEPFAAPLRQMGRTVGGYSLAKARGDLVAGATVAVIAVPQSMAYAIVAGVDPVYGLYTLIFLALVGSLLMSQPGLALGPINTQSLLVASIVVRLVDPGDATTYLGLVVALTLLKGVIQLVMGLAQLGRLVQYVSQSVIVGFTAGAGVLIAASQLPGFLGFHLDRAAATLPGLPGTIQAMAGQIHHIQPVAVALGLLSLAIMLGARRISMLVPGPLIAIVVAGAIVYLAGYTTADLPLIGSLPQALPTPALPGFSIGFLEPLLAGALALAMLGLIESHAVSRNVVAEHGGRVDPNQDLIAQGVTHVLVSFLACMPGSASFSRSRLSRYAGARTAFADFFTGGYVLVIFLLLGPAARYVPLTVIAAILFVIAWQLIDFRYFRRLIRSSLADTIVCFGTLAATLTVPLAYAVFVGIFLNIALYLRRASHLHMNEMVRSPEGPFIERPIRNRAGQRTVMFLQIEGDLFFGVADELEQQLASLARGSTKVVILRLKRTHSADTTVLSVLERFVDQMHAKDGHVLLCGLRPQLMDQLERFGLVDRVGRDNVFPASFGVFTSAKRALHRARELVGSSIDLNQELGDEDETEGWGYSI
ncbi:MAG: SulP family inorganic anion transporter [Phycisphaeraceae bacterium]